MKKGRYYSLGDYSNIKIGFGTVDVIDLKSVYLEFNSWINLDGEDTDSREIEKRINSIRKKLKSHFYKRTDKIFREECIVEFDISYNSLVPQKQTFFNLEITLFLSESVILKNEKERFKNITNYIIDDFIKPNLPIIFKVSKI